jgi:hypothetical protein
MKGLIRFTVKYSWIFIAFAWAFSIVACNKGGPNSVAPISCPPGTVYNGATCVQSVLVPGGIPAGTRIGFFTQSSNYPNPNNGGSTLNQGDGFTTLLKNAMGVCDRELQVGGSNGGISGCAAWAQGYHDMVIVLDGSSANKAKMIIRSYPYVNPANWYYYSLPSWSQFFTGLVGIYSGNMSGVYDPLVLDMTVWPINNNQGFELRANGPTASYAWWRLIQFRVPNGKIEDPAINYTLYIDGGNQSMQTAASGTMVRCQTQNCGIIGL